MQQITLVNDKPLQVKEWQGQRVVTFRDIDSLHQRPDGTASRNFRKNRKHFIPGEDFYTLEPDEIRRAGFERPQGGYAEEMHLITESGYLMLVKSFKDDLAWMVQRALVNSYFRGKITPPPRGFLEACGVIRPVQPEPTPQETAALFLKAIEEALQSGAYYLRPVYQRGALGSSECLGHYDSEHITLYAGAACAVWIAFMGLNVSKASAGKTLWKTLRAAGLDCSNLSIRVNGKNKCVYKLPLSTINAIAGRA